MLIERHITINIRMCCIAGKQAILFSIFGSGVSYVIESLIRQTQHSLRLSAVRCRADIESLCNLIIAIKITHCHRPNFQDAVNRKKVKQHANSNKGSGNNSCHTICLFTKSFANGFHRLQNFRIQIILHFTSYLFGFRSGFHSFTLCSTLKTFFKMLFDKCACFFTDHVFKVQGQNIANNTTLILHV